MAETFLPQTPSGWTYVAIGDLDARSLCFVNVGGRRHGVNDCPRAARNHRFDEILGIGGVAIGLPAQNIVAVLVAINDQIARNNRSDKGTGLANGKTKFSFD